MSTPEATLAALTLQLEQQLAEQAVHLAKLEARLEHMELEHNAYDLDLDDDSDEEFEHCDSDEEDDEEDDNGNSNDGSHDNNNDDDDDDAGDDGAMCTPSGSNSSSPRTRTNTGGDAVCGAGLPSTVGASTGSDAVEAARPGSGGAAR